MGERSRAGVVLRPNEDCCPLLDCNMHCASSRDFEQHLRDVHCGGQVDDGSGSMIQRYAEAFVAANRSAEILRFGQYCRLCLPILHFMQIPPRPTNVSQENVAAHIAIHYALPLFYCKECSVVLPSEDVAQLHRRVGHNLRDIDRGYSPTWDRLFEHINHGYDQALEEALARFREHPPDDAVPVNEALLAVFQRSPQEWRCLFDLGHNELDIFCTLGHSSTLGRLIFSSPPEQIRVYIGALEPHFGQLITHDYGSRALAAIIVYAYPPQWNHYIAQLGVAVNSRPSLRDNVVACHPLRSLMSQEAVPQEVYADIADTLLGDEQARAGMDQWQARGLIFASVLVRDCDAAQTLTREITAKLAQYVASPIVSDPLRMLARLAGRHHQMEVYSLFIREATNQMSNYYSHPVGNLFAQAVLYFAPRHMVGNCVFVHNHLTRNVILSDVIDGPGNYVIQVAIAVTSESNLNSLVESITSPDDLRVLFTSPNGGHIYRRLVETLSDIQVLRGLYNATAALDQARDADARIASLAHTACSIGHHRLRQLQNFYAFRPGRVIAPGAREQGQPGRGAAHAQGPVNRTNAGQGRGQPGRGGAHPQGPVDRTNAGRGRGQPGRGQPGRGAAAQRQDIPPGRGANRPSQ